MKSLVVLILTLISTSAFASYCATVYEGEDFTGSYKEIRNFEDISNLNDHFSQDQVDWDNRISSVHIGANCTLTVYQYQNFGIDYRTNASIGFSYDFKIDAHHNTYSRLGSADNKISSLTCVCR